MKALKSLLICLILILSATLAIACSDPNPPTPPEPDAWEPSGVTLNFIAPSASVCTVAYASEGDAQYADALIKLLSEREMNVSETAILADSSLPDKALLIGSTSKTASVKAKALFDEKKAAAPNDFHWAFCYWEGYLAIYADSELGYTKAFDALLSTYAIGTTLSLRDDLCESGVYTKEEYDEYIAELERIEAEKKKEENDRLLKEFLPIYEEQLEDIQKNRRFGTATKNIGKSEWKSAPTVPTSDRPRLLVTSDTLPLVREALRDDTATNRRFKELLDSVDDDLGKCGAVLDGFGERPGLHNYDKAILELIQIKALGYLVYEHELYGYQAIVYMKNFLLTLDIQYINNDQCREYGNTMFTAALVYDWCYDLLTDEDKKQLMAGIETRTASGECGDPSRLSGIYKRKMEVGFPPSGQSSVSSHGSERQVLRDFLSAAIAFYGDNNSWWDYVAARVYDDYVDTRNYYYQSGISQQGTGVYVYGRHISDMYSAWMLMTATGENPYVGMEKIMVNLLGYECAPGKIFSDGDGSLETKDATKMVHLALLSAYLFENEAMLAQAEHLLGDTALGPNTIDLTSAMLVALRGMSDISPAENRYEGMSLIQYNGHPVGQYITHSAWNDPNSCAVFMKMKERTTANHEHADAGTFVIYYKGLLSGEAGIYSGYSSDHTRQYHQATVSHNGLLIFDASKWNYSSTDKKIKWYSGGQRWPGESYTLEGWLSSEDYTTGKVTGRQHAYTDDTESSPLYAYIAGDITKAYPSETVDYVGRRMLTVYTGNEEFPTVLFVYDDITSDRSQYEKRFLFHVNSQDAPTVDRESQTVIVEGGEGRIVLTCLSKDVTINEVGGRVLDENGNYDCVASSNYLINGYQNVANNNLDDGHWGRIEIVAPEDRDATFMNVIYVTDRGNKNAPVIKSVTQANGVEGGVFDKKIAAVFATSRERETEQISFKTSGENAISYYVSGLAEGKWTVKVDDKDCGICSATAEGGLLTFTAPAGRVVISPAN